MRRILIVGGSGAGKSTLACALGQKTGLPVVHLDQLFWQNGWVSVGREVFDERLNAALQEPAWIIDGNFDRTLPLRLAHCDTAIELDYPRLICLLGVLRRVFSSYGRVRPDMADGCPERLDWDFLRWTWTFRKTQRPRLRQALTQAEAKGVTVLTFHSRKACRRWLNKQTNPSVST